MLLGSADELSAFTRPQLEALAYASLRVADRLGEVLTLIWGLWLLPFAALTMKSGFLPKFLGVLLIITGVAYAVTSVTAIVFPAQLEALNKVVFPLYFGELIVVLWLAIVGAKPMQTVSGKR